MTADPLRFASRVPLLLALIMGITFASGSAQADWWGDDCEEETRLERDVDLAGIRLVAIEAGAGSLEVNGRAGVDQLELMGFACARTSELLREVSLQVERRGDTLVVETVLPRRRDENARLDLEVELPPHLALRIRDSSGSLEVRDVAALELTDSSGSITISQVPGEVYIVADSSGSIDISDVGGVRIDQDSSGSIDVARAASVHIERDSSGSISARDVLGDVYVGSDTSGSIDVNDVGGNFTVRRDTSGGVRHRNVGGVVQIDGERGGSRR
ncbi:MAG: hypothetical protein AAGA68_00335 [Pseudomonadota bacterium]